MKSALKLILLFSLIFFLFLGIVVFILFIYLKISLPSISSLKHYRPKQSNLIFDHNEKIIGFLGKERRIFVPLNKIPPHVVKAFIAAEDANFYKHKGIDFYGLLRALFKNLTSGRIVQGGSTITQQVVKSLLLSSERTLSRKIKEMILAWQIEKNLTKDEILTIYLNHIYLGEGAYGVEAAALTYFNKHVWELNLNEAATLAGLPPGPTRYSPLNNPQAALIRRNYVLRRMAEVGFISWEEAQKIINQPIVVNPKNVNIPWYSAYFIDLVRAELEKILPPEALERGGYRVVTTLDLDWQKKGYENILNFLLQIYKKDAPEIAAVCISNNDGGIRVLVGGKNYMESSFNRALLGKRQAGSAIKPFIWAEALETGVLQPDSILPDEPITLPGADAGKDWSPGNYDGKYMGLISLKDALAYSRNTVSVRIALLLGVERLKNLFARLGFNFPSDLNLSVALGTYEVSPLELTLAYTVFPNLGNKWNPRFIEAIYDQIYGGKLIYQSQPENKPIFSPPTTSIMNDFLQAVTSYGTGKCALALGVPVAGKTGTTQDYKDAWFIGFTADYTCGVWVGYDKGKTLSKGETGGKIACPIWLNLMKGTTHKTKPIPSFKEEPPLRDNLGNATDN
ncbi:MAG: penicillin-binding protein 1A [Caldimicrobium sp.]